MNPRKTNKYRTIQYEVLCTENLRTLPSYGMYSASSYILKLVSVRKSGNAGEIPQAGCTSEKYKSQLVQYVKVIVI